MIIHAQGLGELDQKLAAEECGEIFDTAADTLEYIWGGCASLFSPLCIVAWLPKSSRARHKRSKYPRIQGFARNRDPSAAGPLSVLV